MKSRQILARWARTGARLRAQLKALSEACLQEGNAPEIHRLRVCLRRFRFWARTGQPLLPSRDLARLQAWGRNVATLTGPIRDLDVSIEWFRSHRVGEEIMTSLAERRQTEWTRRRKRLKPLPATVLERLGGVEVTRENGRRLRRRVRRLEQRFEDRLVNRLDGFFKRDASARHEVRRIVRRWRYLRESVQTAPEQKRDRLLTALLAFQEAVGDAQNLELGIELIEHHVPEGKRRRQLERQGRVARKGLIKQTRRAIRRLQRELD
ncbi:MAG: CHAD domain-containing protein [Verrucomicrobiae bacterium]|nr:CHAD domain-containing protein [Verrucomicrobiae bacterium]MCP5522684.1 CHAD domain-containing protein [Verrucomicrobiales bacterium]